LSAFLRILAATVGMALAVTIAASASATTEEGPIQGPCFGGLIDDANSAGKLVGSECSDVIVASPDTTEIEGGEGDDVIIAGENTQEIEGGDGWDYIIGNDTGIVAYGGAGDDVLDGGIAPDPDGLDALEAEQLNIVVDGLPEEEVGEFVAIVEAELREAHDEAEAEGEASVEARLGGNGGPATLAGATTVLASDFGSDLGAPLDEGAQLVDDLPWDKDPIEGESGSNNDVLHGGRGSDDILGYAGNDLLYGGIDDDTLRGGDNADFMLGGMGTDKIDGENGQDTAQGDATGDKMRDTGGGPNDTLSFASGAPDGFGDDSLVSEFPNFPPQPQRGVYISLAENEMKNGSVRTGGGSDTYATSWNSGTNFSEFEHVIGSPFADYIEGDSDANILQGGGGSDVIKGGLGADRLYGDTGGDNLQAEQAISIDGGAGEDYCEASQSTNNCESLPSNWVEPRSTHRISVGMTKTGRTTQGWDGNIKTQLYVAGSIGAFGATNGEDNVEVTQEPNGSGPPKFKFRLMTEYPTGADVWDAKFSTQLEDRSPDCSYAPTEVVCEPDSKSVTLVVAGLGSNDVIELDEMSEDTNPILIGGYGDDNLTGGVDTDDFLVDGPGADHLWGKGKDDGLVNTYGADEVRGENGSDLILSDDVCQGDMLYGGNGTDSASWAKFQVLSTEDGVFAEIDSEKVGRKSGGSMYCPGTIPQNLNDFEDLEGSNGADVLRGDNWTNQLIGRAGEDTLRSLKSTDRILANSADDDLVYCGLPAVPRTDPRADVAKVDYRPNHDDDTSGCDKEDQADAIFVSTDP